MDKGLSLVGDLEKELNKADFVGGSYELVDIGLLGLNLMTPITNVFFMANTMIEGCKKKAHRIYVLKELLGIFEKNLSFAKGVSMDFEKWLRCNKHFCTDEIFKKVNVSDVIVQFEKDIEELRMFLDVGVRELAVALAYVSSIRELETNVVSVDFVALKLATFEDISSMCSSEKELNETLHNLLAAYGHISREVYKIVFSGLYEKDIAADDYIQVIDESHITAIIINSYIEEFLLSKDNKTNICFLRKSVKEVVWGDVICGFLEKKETTNQSIEKFLDNYKK